MADGLRLSHPPRAEPGPPDGSAYRGILMTAPARVPDGRGLMGNPRDPVRAARIDPATDREAIMLRSLRRRTPPGASTLAQLVSVLALVACGEVAPAIDAGMGDMRAGEDEGAGEDIRAGEDMRAGDSSTPNDDCRFDIGSTLPSADALRAQVIEAAGFAPNRTGDARHEAYTDWLVEQLRAIEGLPEDAVRIVEHPDHALRTPTDRPTLTVTLADGSTRRIAVPDAIPGRG